MTRKVSSDDRAISEFRNRKIADISSILATNDMALILKIMNKSPTLSLKTAKAYQKLAKQYIIILQNPTKLQLKHINKKFKVNIIKPVNQTEYYNNLVQLGNEKVYGGGNRPDILDFIQSQIGIRPTYLKNKNIKINFGNLNYKDSLKDLMNILNVLEVDLTSIRSYGYREVRLFIKWKGKANGKIGVMFTSSKVFLFGNYYEIYELLISSQDIVDSGYYDSISGIIYTKTELLGGYLIFYK